MGPSVAAEALCAEYRRHGLCVSILRPKSFIGPERLGVFALLTQTFADQGLELFRPLAGYFATVVLCLVLHLALSYSALLRASR